MSEPIKVGDLVVVVKPTPCCRDTSAIGEHHTIIALVGGLGRCNFCGHYETMLDAKVSVNTYFDLHRLKRIPPLSELEGEKRDEEITA